MASVGQVITLIGSICGIIVLIAGGLVIARSSFSRAQIEALREDNKDLRDRSNDQHESIVHLESEVVRLSNENELLRGLVTQRAQVEQVLAELNVHHEAAMEVWDKMDSKAEETNTHLTELTTGMTDVAKELGRLGRR